MPELDNSEDMFDGIDIASINLDDYDLGNLVANSHIKHDGKYVAHPGDKVPKKVIDGMDDDTIRETIRTGGFQRPDEYKNHPEDANGAVERIAKEVYGNQAKHDPTPSVHDRNATKSPDMVPDPDGAKAQRDAKEAQEVAAKKAAEDEAAAKQAEADAETEMAERDAADKKAAAAKAAKDTK